MMTIRAKVDSMPSHSYIQNSMCHVLELDGLTDQPGFVAALNQDIRAMGEIEWYRWYQNNETEIRDFLRATPGQREKKKKWQEPVLKARLIFAAWHQARCAVEVVKAAERLQPGHGYRDITVEAARFAEKIYFEGFWAWPFCDVDDESDKPPFGWRRVYWDYETGRYYDAPEPEEEQ
jgi:hypothetical protein